MRNMSNRTKRNMRAALAVCLVMSLLGSCAPGDKADVGADSPGTDVSVDVGTDQGTEGQAVSGKQEGTLAGISDRPVLIKSVVKGGDIDVVPCVEPYAAEPGLSNVSNTGQFYLSDEQAQKLVENGFVVSGGSGSEFYEIYEQNRYKLIPNFVTVDSLMHTYHLYFSHLLKSIERDTLFPGVTELSRRMLENSRAQYGQLKGSEWEDAARRNVAFFTVGSCLLDDSTQVDADVADIVAYELENICQDRQMNDCKITDGMEDYTQYIPRGYYEGDEKLERYFRAMMWYGRIHFKWESEDLDRSAFLITMALAGDAQAYEEWESIYAVTSFFAGASDDSGVCEYAPVIREVYGDGVTVSDLPGTEEAFQQFHEQTAQLSVPMINSVPIGAGESNVVPGFRFMGQRFTIDGLIMQKLVFSNVSGNREGALRMLPDVLDVPAALGSDVALGLLEENGATDYAGYLENMELLREGLSGENDVLWSASLYANWMNTLRPLLEPKGEGYPLFMQNGEWAKKDLECFAGSFTELKHDTILYSKQVMAEMGGEYYETMDDRGYVEPEPLVYARFANLADATAQGLKGYGMLDAAGEENLTKLSQVAGQLLTISQKELQNEPLTDEEYEFIRTYGGILEHFWYDAVKSGSDGEYINPVEYPAALVVDIATDPNGWVLEAATDNPETIYVVVKVDGTLKIASGSVYSFYQLVWPMEDRLTDSSWRQMMGHQVDEDGNYHYDESVDRPDWTKSYRYEWNS